VTSSFRLNLWQFILAGRATNSINNLDPESELCVVWQNMKHTVEIDSSADVGRD
jgi:hypothetical protein